MSPLGCLTRRERTPWVRRIAPEAPRARPAAGDPGARPARPLTLPLDAMAKRHADGALAGTLLRGQLDTAVDHLTDLSVAAERDRPGPVAFAEDDDHLVVEVEGGEIHEDASWSGPAGRASVRCSEPVITPPDCDRRPVVGPVDHLQGVTSGRTEGGPEHRGLVKSQTLSALGGLSNSRQLHCSCVKHHRGPRQPRGIIRVVKRCAMPGTRVTTLGRWPAYPV
jgi:hypothetical protein